MAKRLAHLWTALQPLTCWWLVTGASPPIVRAQIAAQAEPPTVERGALGWGLSIDVPTVGVTAHAPHHGQTGFGYGLGAGLVYERARPWLVRLQIERSGTREGRDYITYLSSVNRLEDCETAAWGGTLVYLGGAYAWVRPGRGWTPYIGLAATLGYGGYTYAYGDTAKKLEPPTSVLARALGHTAEAWIFGGGANGGAELQLKPWLATFFELSAVVLPFGTPQVSNNLPSRDVRAAADVLLLLQARFGVRVLL